MANDDYNVLEAHTPSGRIVMRHDHKGGYWVGRFLRGSALPMRLGPRKLSLREAFKIFFEKARLGFELNLEEEKVEEKKMESKALQIKEYLDQVDGLIKEIDKFNYDHGLAEEVGKPLVTALNGLVSIQGSLREAAREQAFLDLEEGTGRDLKRGGIGSS